MTVGPTTLLFFDASCLIAATGSPSGGSAFLLSVCARGLLRAAVSQAVLLEAERNIRLKLPPDALGVYRRLIVLTPMTIVALPSKADQRRYRTIVGEKDEHVVAAAISAGAPFLLTLDTRLQKSVNEANLPIQALSPAAFIKTVLIHHVDYPSIR
ncbi:MAG: PIN domain-containing protein [Chloroflexi bacterium]|nr:PIN domain-containing protein [Chloroflexota bacterium]